MFVWLCWFHYSFTIVHWMATAVTSVKCNWLTWFSPQLACTIKIKIHISLLFIFYKVTHKKRKINMKFEDINHFSSPIVIALNIQFLPTVQWTKKILLCSFRHLIDLLSRFSFASDSRSCSISSAFAYHSVEHNNNNLCVCIVRSNDVDRTPSSSIQRQHNC